MKLKHDKLKMPEVMIAKDAMSPVEADRIKANQKQIKNYIKSVRSHLETLRSEVYSIVDSSELSVSSFNVNKTSQFKDDIKTNKLSVFIQKAYTEQCYDESGQAMENREQAYISAGTGFTKYCESNPVSVTQTEALLNDVGATVGAINSALSQLNKVEASLIKAQNNPEELEITGSLIAVIPGCLEAVVNQAEKSKVVEVIPNQSIIQKLISNLSELATKLSSFLSVKSYDEQYKDKFDDFNDKFENNVKDDVLSDDLNSEPEEEPKPGSPRM